MVHVHIGHDARKICKFWLRHGEVILADNSGFTKRELEKIAKTGQLNYQLILKTFNEYCKGYKK